MFIIAHALSICIKLAEEILNAFLKAKFSTEEYFRRRVAKLAEFEKKGARELFEGD